MSEFERPTLLTVGPLGRSKETTIYRLVKPLEEDFDIVCIPGNWNDKNETDKQKIQRVRDKIDQIGAKAVVGISAGGPLAVAAAYDVETVEGIVTVASPLAEPKEMNLKLKILQKRYPHLYQLLQHVIGDIIPNLSDERKESMLTVGGARDGTVPPEMNHVSGVATQKLIPPKMLPTLLTHQFFNIREPFRSSVVKDFLNEKLNR